MAASSFLAAAAACIILLCFAAEGRKSQCNGGVKVANGALAVICPFWYYFPFKIPCKKCFKIVVFQLWRRDPVLELQIAASCG